MKRYLHLAHAALYLVFAAGIGAQVPLPPSATGYLYLSGSTAHLVAECQPDGTVLRTLTPAGMVTPRGLAFDDDGNLLIVCEGSARILRVRLDGTVLQTIQHPDLNLPTGIARAQNGAWYVGNFSPGRVLVFDAALVWQSTLTQAGMTGVNCVSFDPSGDFAVTAALTAQVHRFNAQNQWLGLVSHSSLASPMSIARDSSGHHYVSNGGSALVSKFDANWAFVAAFGTGILNGPQGIAIDERDVLTVTNFYSNAVARYSPAGVLLGGFAHQGLGTVRNLAFQVAPPVLARVGSVGAQSLAYQRPLVVNGQTGDFRGEVTLSSSAPCVIDLLALVGSGVRPPYVLFVEVGSPAIPVALPFGLGWFAFSTVLTGGTSTVLSDNLLNGALGSPLLPTVGQGSPILNLPLGAQIAATVTLQGFVLDPAARTAPALPVSPTNALVLTFL